MRYELSCVHAMVSGEQTEAAHSTYAPDRFRKAERGKNGRLCRFYFMFLLDRAMVRVPAGY